MKTQLLAFLFASLLTFTGQGQNLLNPSFDSVYFGGIDRVFEWITSDGIIFSQGTQGDTVMPLQASTFYNATGFMFSEILWFGNRIDTSPISVAAIQISSRPRWRKTDGSPYEANVINGNHLYTNKEGYPDLSRCGIPFTQRPTKLTGHYWFIDSSATGNNFGKCIILLKRWNTGTQQSDTIAFTDDVTTLNPGTTIQPFEIPFNYTSTATPDTLMVAFFAASNPESPATLWLDELDLVYTGIGMKEANRAEIDVYPNPAYNWLHIETNEVITQVSLFNMLGQSVYSQSNANDIFVGNFHDGIYLLHVETKTGIHIQKVVIQQP